jgi:molybdenum cofactor cytidylyltransferase
MHKREKRVSAILLGAGRSLRMGRDKLMLPWGKKTVFEHCLGTLLRSDLEEVNVIFSERNQAVKDWMKDYPPLFRRRIKLVQNRYWRRGMSTSIRRGLESLCPDAQGILIVLGDQPLLKRGTVNALIHAFTPGREEIVVPFYGKKRGNPVLFDRSYIRKLSKLRGDVGGRSVIDRHPDKVIRVRTRSEAVVTDIDTWEEYERLKSQGKKGNRQKAAGSRKKD